MPKKKAAPSSSQKREKMSWNQVDGMARAVAGDLMMSEAESVPTLMLLLDEISKHPFDPSHLETVANLLIDNLFACTIQSDVACKTFIARERRKLAEREVVS